MSDTIEKKITETQAAARSAFKVPCVAARTRFPSTLFFWLGFFLPSPPLPVLTARYLHRLSGPLGVMGSSTRNSRRAGKTFCFQISPSDSRIRD